MDLRRSPKARPALNRVPVAREEESSSATVFAEKSEWGGVITREHPVFSSHMAFGRSLLPGLAYIDIIYQWCKVKGLDPTEIEIRNLSIFQPMTLDEAASLVLSPALESNGANAWTITIQASVREKPGGTSVDRKFATAELLGGLRPVFAEKIDTRALGQTAYAEIEQTYARWRELELVHGGRMKANGRVHLSEKEVCVFIEGSRDVGSTVVDPLIVDASIVGAFDLIQVAADGETRLFLPLHFGSFRIVRPISGTSIARIRRDSVRRKGELIVVDIEYFDSDGNKVAELRTFNNKLVRDHALISSQQGRREERVVPTVHPATYTSDPAIETIVRSIVANQLGTTPSSIDIDKGYYDLGLSSPVMIEVVRLIADATGQDLSPTLLFEYTNVRALIAHLSPEPAGPPDAGPAPIVHNRPRPPQLPVQAVQRIAVVGLAGLYPGSTTLDEFWANLAAGRDLITEVPAERWSWRELEKVHSPSGKPMSRWGGFIDDVAMFDPQFFRISPKEAEGIDPQERLFLQVCWEAMEDAGYTPRNIVKPTGRSARRRVGVFAGVMHKDYMLIGSEALRKGNDVALSLNHAPIANRVSYTCDFHGPSLAVDTVCSASLTAIHLAIESLRSGECSVAIAGGVNLSLHPNKYLTYGMLDMHASDGRCRAFGDGGDGYVSAEGVGAAILKPLDQAVADGDNIYGVVLASAVNHVGRASGMTVPSPVAQGEMIAECLEKAEVDPRSISYMEAHGTGTSLGDPIEVQGLIRAFRDGTSDEGFCALGSVKSNIGHAEAAAGISGLTKALLQIRHKTIVSTLHATKVNPLANLAGSPFYLPTESRHWSVADGGVRRAGISSFGATGSNAHVLIEEYVPAPNDAVASAGPVLIPLSARTEEQLSRYAAKLATFLQECEEGARVAPDLPSLAYTLQTGRIELPVRVALLSQSHAETVRLLQAFLERRSGTANIWWNAGTNSDNDLIMLFERDPELRKAIDHWIARGKFADVAGLWVKGATIDWDRLYPDMLPSRVSLPTYPFGRERYWVTQTASQPIASEALAGHPLIRENVSDLAGPRFASRFSGQEAIFHPRGRGGKMSLLAQLGLGLSSLHRAWPNPSATSPMGLSDIAWVHPVVATETGCALETSLFNIDLKPDEPLADVEITGFDGDDRLLVHLRAQASAQPEAAPIDLSALRQRTERGNVDTDFLASLQQGFRSHGEGLALTDARVGTNEVLLTLRPSVPEGAGGTTDMLWPTLDVAVRTALELLGEPGQASTPLKAATLASAMVYTSTVKAARLLVWARQVQDGVLDIDLCDCDGDVLVRLQGLAWDGTSRIELNSQDAAPPLWFEETWNPTPHAEPPGAPPVGVGLFLTARQDFRQHLSVMLAAKSPGIRAVFVATGDRFQRISRVSYVVRPEDSGDLRRLLDAVHGDFGEIQSAYYLWPMEREATIGDHVAFANLIQVAATSAPKLRHLVVAGHATTPEAGALVDAFVGFQRSLPLALPQLSLLVVSFDSASEFPLESSEALSLLMMDIVQRATGSVRYLGSSRYTPGIGEVVPVNGNGHSPFRHGGVYLITGGLGGLGLSMAEYLSRHYAASCILVSRSSPNHSQIERMAVIEGLGGQVVHVCADVTSEADMTAVFNQAEIRFGVIHGVFHAAGIVGAEKLLQLTLENFRQVLSAKIDGTILLEKLLRTRTLDLVCLFSSSAAVVGDFGSCDYAVANRFQLAFGKNTQTLFGFPWITVAWPLWRDGGMGLGDRATEQYLAASGQRLLEVEEAMRALEGVIRLGRANTVIQVGDAPRLREFLARKVGDRAGSASIVEREVALQAQPVDGTTPQLTRIMSALRDIVHGLLHLPVNELHEHLTFDDFGFDSITFTQFSKVIRDKLGIEVAPSVFYVHSTLRDLAAHVVGGHESSLSEPFRETMPVTEVTGAKVESASSGPTTVSTSARRGWFSQRTIEAALEPIAIIGMSGRFPGAENVDSLWRLLERGECAITEIPPDHFDWRNWFDPLRSDEAMVGKWLGGLHDYTCFDANFFEISPREADAMDPRQRLLLQEAWRALEDAALTGAPLGRGRIGVFVGAEQGDYQLLDGERGLTSNHDGILAARLSYFLNLKAPVLTINTACSSGLVALHQACLSLRAGECEAALAAGVNLLLSPASFAQMAAAGMLSPDGLCRSFDRKANGLVPGEAVAVIVLKKLSDALADGDPIRSIIAGHGINYDGRTNGITAPSGLAQAELIGDIYRRFEVDVDGIDHVVAHGTGTRLGDPVEVTALATAFAGHNRTNGSCALTSNKPNLGHTFAASGLVSVISLVQGMAHDAIPPSLNCEDPSNYLDWDNSPFYVNQSRKTWPGVPGRRRLGAVSAFGMSGTNAHVVLADAKPFSQPKN